MRRVTGARPSLDMGRPALLRMDRFTPASSVRHARRKRIRRARRAAADATEGHEGRASPAGHVAEERDRTLPKGTPDEWVRSRDANVPGPLGEAPGPPAGARAAGRRLPRNVRDAGRMKDQLGRRRVQPQYVYLLICLRLDNDIVRV